MSDNRKAFEETESKIWAQTRDKGMLPSEYAWKLWQAATEQSSKEIERLNALVAMQAETLKDISGCENDENHIAAISFAQDALSASSETVEAWKAKMLEPLQRQVAMLRTELVQASFSMQFNTDHSFAMKQADSALAATQATAEAYDREHAAKVLEDAAEKFSSVEGYTKNIRVEISGWLELQAAELRAANK